MRPVTHEVRLYGFEGVDAALLKGLVTPLSEELEGVVDGLAVETVPIPEPTGSFNPTRNQYRAVPFLKALRATAPPHTHGLALVDLDLYVEDLNFIFGVATFNGNALVALARLRPQFYALDPDPELFFTRVLKECLHELGHVFGLDHCTNNCVMRFSNTLADTDAKPAGYCDQCRSRMLTSRAP